MYDYNYDYVNPGFNTTGVEETGELVENILGVIALFGIGTLLITLVVTILLIISNWKIFEKAKRNGWESLVPIHNMFVLLEIAGTPTWHIFLFFVPIANVYAIFRMYIDLAHKFGKSTGFGVATVLFNFICLPILAFSKKVKYDSVDDLKEEVNPATNNMNVTPINQNVVAEEPTPLPTMVNVENAAPATEQQVIMPEPVNFVNGPVTEPQQVNVEAPMFLQNTNVTENVVPVQNIVDTPMQPVYNGTMPTQSVVSEPTMPIQNEIPVQNVLSTQPVIPQEPVVSNTVVMLEQNNNNQNGPMM